MSSKAATAKRSIKVLDRITKNVSIRKTHPAMYRVLMIVAVMFVALALNLYLTTPTFNPYGISKTLIATIFLVLGVSKIIFLNIYHNLKLVRLMVAIATSFMMFWGVSNSQQSFAGKASFQLPILYITLALINLPFLVEPASNPLTKNGGIDD